MDKLDIESLFKNIYSGKKVLITGHTGFKGSWLTLWLTLMGAKVVGYSLQPESTPNHFDLLKLDVQSNVADIGDIKKLRQIIEREKPEIIFHLAAQSLVRESYKNPINTFSTNIMGTANLLEVCRKAAGLKAVIVVTSDKCYENREKDGGYVESDPLGGHDPYSASKGCTEIITSSYHRSFFPLDKFGKSHSTLIATCRAGNVIGGGDWANDRLIPDAIKAAASGRPVFLRKVNAVRPWQYVLEPLSGYLMLGQQLLDGKTSFAEAWNFGPHSECNITVEEVINHLKKYWNKIDYRLSPQDGLHEETLLQLDCSKAHSKLGWQPVLNLKKTVEITAQWYGNYYEKGHVDSKKQLGEYITKARKQKIKWAV